MSKTSKIILVTIIATCILLGLGYAAITNITLNIAGTASATVDSGNFKVRFTDNIEVSDNAYVTATRTGDTAATINVSGLTTAGDKVTATYEIVNDSIDLSSDLNVKATNSNANYFSVSSRLADKSLTAGSNTTVLVTVELLKTPIDADVSTNIGVTLNAIPVQPGEEGSSGLTNDFSKVPINGTLNEYGFFYNEAYSGVIEEDGKTSVVSFVAYEDGHMEWYMDDTMYMYFTSDKIVYSENLITINMYDSFSLKVSVIENGYQLNFQETILDLNDSFIDNQTQDAGELNEYGFYYDVPYVARYLDESFAIIFHEDSTISYYENGIYADRDNVTYAENKSIIDEDYYLPIYENGKVVLFESNIGLRVTPDFELTKGVYITINSETGETEYLDVFPETVNVGDVYAVGDYKYTYISTSELQISIIEDATGLPNGYEYSGKGLEKYPEYPYVIYGGVVRSLAHTFENCVNLKTAPVINDNITNMTNTFKGCTSLEGEIVINIDYLYDYEGCFEGVDMSKITLTGDASDEIKDLLGKTGNNYTPLIPE